MVLRQQAQVQGPNRGDVGRPHTRPGRGDESERGPHLASSAAWRLACRLHDLGYFKGTPVRYEQTYPVRAMEKYNAQHGPNMPDPSQYGPKAHERIFGK